MLWAWGFTGIANNDDTVPVRIMDNVMLPPAIPGVSTGGTGLQNQTTQTTPYDVTVRAGNPPTVLVQGEVLATPVHPQILSGTTFVPLRAVTEALGAELDWYAPVQRIEVTLSDSTVTLHIGSTDVGGSDATLTVAPFIQDGSTMVPIRLIAEAFGFTVGFQQ